MFSVLLVRQNIWWPQVTGSPLVLNHDMSVNDVNLPFFSQERGPVYHPTPNVSRPVTQLSEEEQIKIAKRIGLIHHLPTGIYDGSKKAREYVYFNDFQ